MDRVELDGTAVEFESRGAGEPVVLLHARPFVGWYGPLADALRGRLVVRYRRPVPLDAELTIERDAGIVAALLGHLGIERPHLVGHSYGALVALALAGQVATRSVALIEPATAGLLEPAVAAERFSGLLQLARDAGPQAAMGAFLSAVCGPDAANQLDRAVPGAATETFANAEGFFAAELPAVVAYDIVARGVAEITAPVLNMIGTASGPRFVEAASIIDSWFPAATRREIPGANHLLIAQQPAEVGAVLEAWWRSLPNTGGR